MALSLVFPNRDELGKAKQLLNRLCYEYHEVNSLAHLDEAAVPFLVVRENGSEAVHTLLQAKVALSGRVEYRPPLEDVDQGLPCPPEGQEDIVGRVVVMSLTPCAADPEKIRLIAHISGDLSKVMPYLNAVRRGSYNPNANTFSYIDAGRMISLFQSKIAAAKAHEVLDGYATLWRIKCWINAVWARRESIELSYESRKAINVLEIFKRLPGTNCRKCGELTCMAFAALTLQGKHGIAECRPVFENGEYPQLLPPLQQIADGYGL